MRNVLNPLNELSDIYLGNISEEDNSPEAIKARVMQHVRAIRYRARKEGENLNKAYNEFMGGQSGISSTEKQMVKERLGLTGGAAHVGEGYQRDPEQSKKDKTHSKQPDPSEDGFTGIGNMTIDDIVKMNKKIKEKSKKEEVENDAQEITEISADLALKASKKAEVERGKAAVAGNRERAVAKLKQSSRLYAKQAAKRRKENAGG